MSTQEYCNETKCAVAPSATELAERLTGRGRYDFDVLVEGIALAQQLMRPGPYVLMLWQSVLNYEGIEYYVYLSDACEQMEARRRAARKIHDLEAIITNRNNERIWKRTGGGGGPVIPSETPYWLTRKRQSCSSGLWPRIGC
jgi:hypothetical protein